MIGALVGVVFGLYVLTALVSVIGVIISAVFSGAISLIAGLFAFSGEEIVLGIVIGFVAFRFFRRRNAVKNE